MKSQFLSKFLLPFLAFAFIMGSMATQAGAAINVDPFHVFAIGTATTFVYVAYIQTPTAYFKNAVEVEVWVNYIKEKLFKVNPFLQYATNHDDKVLGGKVVHLPQAGGPSTIVKNRNSFPATAVQRTDTDITYNLDNYTSDPVHILLNNLQEISYDKIDSVVGQDMRELVQVVADDLLIKWCSSIPQANIVPTTGADSALYLKSGATGTRKVFDEKQLRLAVRKIKNQNVFGDLYAQFSVDMHDQLVDSLSQTQYSDFSRAYNPETGIVGKLHGVTILEPRSSVVTFDDDAGDQVVNALGAAETETANDASLLWSVDSVARAMGETKLFSDPENPLYYGDVYSAMMRMGGRRTRTDNKGIVAIVQDTSA